MNIEDLKKTRSEIEVPVGLDAMVTARLSSAPKSKAGLKVAVAAIFASVGVLNAIPAVATELRSFSIAQPVVDFLTLNRFDFKATSPDLRDYGSIGVELTDKYAAEAKALYEEYLASVETPADFNKAVESSYEILWQSDEYLVVQHSLLEVMASGYEQVSYDVVDLENQKVLQLSDLIRMPDSNQKLGNLIFQDLHGQSVAGAAIFIDELAPETVLERVSDFYANAEGDLVFVFNEYEIAAGSQGVVKVKVNASSISEFVENTALVN